MTTGIPTEYNYRRFRSRLEARWARMFDLLGWPYEYEPYDLNGWIPDFVLLGHEEILVEVKPFHRLEQFDTEKVIRAAAGTDKQGLEVLLLGFTLPRTEEGDLAVGWLGEAYDTGYWFEPAPFCGTDQSFDFAHPYGSYRLRMSGFYDGSLSVLRHTPEVQRLWSSAGNAVQWRRA